MRKRIITLSLLLCCCIIFGSFGQVLANNRKKTTSKSTKITTQKAASMVRSKLKIPKSYRVEYDHNDKKNGKLYYVIHGYQVVVDDPSTGMAHTATFGWYYVDSATGKIYNWDLASDKLIPVK